MVATVALVVTWVLVRAGEGLRASEARQRAIIESARDAIITVDGESRILEINRATEELFGYRRGDMVGKPIDMIFPPALLPAVHAGRRHYRETGDSPALAGRMEFDARRADGTEFPAEFTFSHVAAAAPSLVTVCVRDMTEARRAADALRRSAERFRTIIETSSEIVSIVGDDGTVRYVSAAVEPILGYAPAELIGTDGFALVHSEDLPGTRAQLALGMAHPDSSGTGAFRLRHKDGSWRIIESVTRNLIDDPDVRGVVYFARDVTARHRAEREYRLLETVEGSIAAAPDGIAACAIALQTVCEALAWTVGELWTPSAAGTALERALVWNAGGEAVERFAAAGETLRLPRHGGITGLAWFERRAQLVGDLGAAPELERTALAAECGLRVALVVPVLADDRPLALFVLFAPAMPAGDERPVEMVAARLGELLKRRQAEDARHASEALNRAVLSSLGAHIAVVDRKGIVITVNDAWRRFALANGDQSGGRLTGVGMNYLDICAAAGGDPHARATLQGIREVLAGSRAAYSLEYPNVTPTGERRWFELVVTPLLGEQRGAVLAHTDVTERKRAEQMLIEARESALDVARMKDEFLANLSHELRTPMTAIIGMNMLALETDLTPEQREYLDVVQSSSAALLELINELLDFSRIEAGKLRIERIEFELRRTVGDAMKALVLRTHEGVLVTWDVAADVPDALVGDPGRLRQVLGNLVGNAMKFTPQGTVVVSVAHERVASGLMLHLRVADTGIGIAPEKQRRIFEPFVQGDGSSTRRYGGTGIGLAITGRLVDLMGGTIRVESEIGRGSTFHVALPVGIGERARSPLRLAATDAKPSRPAPKGAPGSSAEPTRNERERVVNVLLAEDEPVNRTVILRLLERRGYRVTPVADGARVLDLLAQERFDVIVMDVQMPHMDGLEAAALIRARPAAAGGDVPIIALTAHARVGDRERCLAAGMSAYLSKPVSADELFATIATLVPRTPGRTKTMEEAMATAIDREEIMGRLSGDRELIGEVVDLFVADRATLVGDLRRAVAENDLNAAREAAHRLKGVLATLAARAAVSTARKLEELARKGDLSEAPAALDTLEREVDGVQAELKKLVKDLAASPAA